MFNSIDDKLMHKISQDEFYEQCALHGIDAEHLSPKATLQYFEYCKCPMCTQKNTIREAHLKGNNNILKILHDEGWTTFKKCEKTCEHFGTTTLFKYPWCVKHRKIIRNEEFCFDNMTNKKATKRDDT